METKELGGGWKLTGIGKSSRWRRLVDPNGRQYRPEDLDVGSLVRFFYEFGVGLTDDRAEAFNEWGGDLFRVARVAEV